MSAGNSARGGWTTGTAIRAGRSLHWTSAGRGTPTVLLEAGIGASSSMWELVFDSLAELTRVIAYDRVGYGGSGPGEPGAEAALLDLEAVLTDASVDGPIVLVGHSWGGVLARLFTVRHPEQVAAVVLVDATHEGVPLLRSPAVLLLTRVAFAVEERRARRGRMRRHLEAGKGPLGSVIARLPPTPRERLISELINPQPWRQARRETGTIGATLRTIPAALPDIAVVAVVGAGPGSRSESRLRRQLGAAYREWLSTLARGRLVEVPDSGHLVPLEQPEFLIGVLRDVLITFR